MKIKIIIFLGIFIFIQNFAHAMDSREKLTRISIASSQAVEYESKWIDSPPRLILKFRAPNVFGNLVRNTALNEGVIKNITVGYYPDNAEGSGRKQIKFLTFWLSQKTDYKVWNDKGKIFIDFRDPTFGREAKQIEISSIISAVDLNSKNKAADDLLASVTKIYDAPVSNAVTRPPSKNMDLAWLLAFLFIGVYILWFRPKEWKDLIGRFVNQAQDAFSSSQEKRNWWRHNLLPLKDNNIYVKLESPESNTNMGLIPRDIGYGGLRFECNRLKKLKGKLNLSIFMPGAISPVEVEGNIAWQKNSWNIFRRQMGVSFINPPEKDWARIHRYIEEQYAALKQ